MISVAVIAYQLFFIIALGVARSFGRRYLLIAFIIALAWTLTHLFFLPLMILQLFVICSSSFFYFIAQDAIGGINALFVTVAVVLGLSVVGIVGYGFYFLTHLMFIEHKWGGSGLKDTIGDLFMVLIVGPWWLLSLMGVMYIFYKIYCLIKDR